MEENKKIKVMDESKTMKSPRYYPSCKLVVPSYFCGYWQKAQDSWFRDKT